MSPAKECALFRGERPHPCCPALPWVAPARIAALGSASQPPPSAGQGTRSSEGQGAWARLGEGCPRATAGTPEVESRVSPAGTHPAWMGAARRGAAVMPPGWGGGSRVLLREAEPGLSRGRRERASALNGPVPLDKSLYSPSAGLGVLLGQSRPHPAPGAETLSRLPPATAGAGRSGAARVPEGCRLTPCRQTSLRTEGRTEAGRAGTRLARAPAMPGGRAALTLGAGPASRLAVSGWGRGPRGEGNRAPLPLRCPAPAPRAQPASRAHPPLAPCPPPRPRPPSPGPRERSVPWALPSRGPLGGSRWRSGPSSGREELIRELGVGVRA